VNTNDNREFILAEFRNAVESMNDKKTSGEDCITGEIFKQAFDTFPKYVPAMYNECLRINFSKEVEMRKTASNC